MNLHYLLRWAIRYIQAKKTHCILLHGYTIIETADLNDWTHIIWCRIRRFKNRTRPSDVLSLKVSSEK